MSGRNVRGGKAFKKGKKKPTDGNAGHLEKFFGRDEGQDYARVTVMLGNRRVRAICNDGVERIMKIRGRLCKGRNKKIIHPGDLVLYSTRDFNGSDSDSEDEAQKAKNKAEGVCDLLDRIEPDFHRMVKKEAGVNPILFQNETKATSVPLPPVDDTFGEAPPVEKKVEAPESEADSDSDSDSEVNIDAI